MRILYISYFYPPLGGPAVLRNVKTVKHLSRLGFEVDVITIKDIEYLYRDESLLAQCSERSLIRTESFDPMAIFRKLGKGGGKHASKVYMDTPERLKLIIRRAYPIDNKIAWLPFLIRAGKKALRETKYELIYISLGPFSSALGAYYLSKGSGIPYAVDMRDYWNLLSDYELQGSALHRRFARYWEAKIYRHAALIVSATKGIGEDIAAAFGSDLSDKTITVYNGWDEEDFEGLLPAKRVEDGFVLAYFGNIYARRSLKSFYAAVRELRSENALPPNTRIKLYGNFFRETLQEIEQSGIGDIIHTVPQLPHREALSEMLAADALLLTINSSSPTGTLTSKVFEYLRCRKAILAMVPAHKEAAALLRENGNDYICAMESPTSIREALSRLIADRDQAVALTVPQHLERGNQILLLAEKLREMFPE
ncbi:MAG: glycosyltransferase [Candidatus Cloacimonadaceae bacterium]|nr:glycosyltransferase [Candidatus Cloacimonadaceae bacterium]